MKPSQNQVDNTVPTPSFDAVYAEELAKLGETAEPVSEKKSTGSSDVGNVSQVIPTIQPHIRISATPIAGYSEDFKKAACSELGLASIGLGAEVLAATALRLIEMSAQTCDFSRGSSRPGFEDASCCKICST